MIKMKYGIKKLITILLILISTLSSVIAAYAISIPSSTVREEVKEISVINGKLNSSAVFTGKSIYSNGSSLKYYPESITQIIQGKYTISTKPPENGEYLLRVNTTYYVQEGKTRIVLWSETLMTESGNFTGEKILNFSITPPRLEADLERIKTGVGISRIQQDVKIRIMVRTDNSKFDHTISLLKKSGLYSFSSSEKTERESSIIKISENKYLTGMKVEDARALYAGLAVSAIIPAIILNRDYTSKIGKRKTERGVMIVNGQKTGNKILLESFEDLKKVFQLSDSPVVKSKDGNKEVYTIEAAGVIYEYRS